MTKLFQLKFLRASLYLIFVAFFLSHRYALAENMPSRKEIFENFAIGRPAVNQTGSLVAVSGLNGANVISMLDVKFPNNDRILNIDGINQIYWYRWSAQKNDVLIISCKQNRRDVIVEFDNKKGLLSQVISSAEEQSSSFATTKNNYAFTYDRYWNKENKSLSELTTDGDLIPVQDRRNLFPATNQPGDGFIHVGFQNGEMVWSFGVEKNKQTQLKINAMDQRQGTGLVSIASSNHHAYFLSSVNTDTLALLEIDLKSGEQKIIAQENADIRKVILNPSTHIPEAVEYENTKPVFKVLGNSIIDDIAFLSSRGLGIPSVVDRSPNDLFWIVKYAHGDGFPIFAIYDKKNKYIKKILANETMIAGNSDWRVQSFSLSRAGEPSISGYVSLPREARCAPVKCPAVLLLHGGPGERDFSGFDPERFWLTSRGMIVISVNYRGSRGFGKRFEALDRLEWDSGIPKDVMDSLDYALKKYPIDPSRIAVVGTSFSGYLALNLMAVSSKFKCGIVDSTSADLLRFSEARLADYGDRSDLLWRVGDPRIPDERLRLIAMSPVSRIDKLKNARLLQFHGGRDSLVRMEINADFSPELLKVNTHYTFVFMPDASHGLLEARKQYHSISELFLEDCLNLPVENLDETERSALDGLLIYGQKTFLSRKH